MMLDEVRKGILKAGTSFNLYFDGYATGEGCEIGSVVQG